MRLGELEAVVGEEDATAPRARGGSCRACIGGAPRSYDGGAAGRPDGAPGQALFGNPQALLLDYSLTNHLDLDSFDWLKDFLVRYEGTLIVISD